MGIIVAGHIVEETTGMTWEAALASLLFEPLGIQLTADPISKMTGAPNNSRDAWGHSKCLNFLIPCDPAFPFFECDNPTVYGPAGTFSGPHAAMARYLAFHVACHRGDHDGLLLSQESCQTLHSPANASITTGFGVYGYGWFCIEEGRVCYHDSSNVLNLYEAWLVFDKNRAYAAMTNQPPTPEAYDAVNHTITTMIELPEDQEDCSARIPSSVYIDH
ncbi:beta-lactamase [Seminavis robusta]|uniref:Beta-lactamase n=1 Tax=Seminavis robusta TaxID=568900 RepID=A0A9N8EDA7_9STRA|nr:beta-lactamase [Seminavis robusta]|eukprot:Sro1009_g230740.1 beta-lactamase (218) ;mRNA; r:32113-32766